MRTKQVPTLSNRASSTTPVKHAKLRTSGAESSLDTPFRDDDSLTSCPPFSVPNYMVPTVSAKVKVRAYSNLPERFPATSNHEQKRRLSFPLTQSIGSIRWNKGSLFSNKDYDSQKFHNWRMGLVVVGPEAPLVACLSNDLVKAEIPSFGMVLVNTAVLSETGQQEEWDDSLLTKEEIKGRLQKKVEAVMKKERAVAYAYSHQLWKATPKSAQTALMEIRSGGFPWWWNWLERQLAAHPSESQAKATGVKNDLTPPKLILEPAVRQPQSSNHTKPSFRYETLDTVTPKSFKPSVAMRTKQVPTLSNRASSTTPVKHAKLRTSGAESSLDTPFRDDDSLTSCPPFSVPNYMVPTVSAKAKVRAYSNLRERFPATSNHEQKRRLSFPLTQSIGSFRWNKGSLFSNKDYDSQKVLGKHRSTQSIGNMSVDSTVSLPAGVGRKAFK
ncbi:hypothetical protein HHK36_032707 [Tetracentron sinense]|uniref:DUF4005 domain-containing protein n=1 Tax=Tetracentron sinense TaxID=13715 RepID=A0A835CXC3_TETSI|nr:hypothetical protein HHK36_032707 [Tetracentron sinense]